MSPKLKKLHWIIDQPPTHLKLVMNWNEEQPTAFLCNEILTAIKPADNIQEELVETPLFDKNNLAKMIEEIGYKGHLLIILRPRYKLERIIVEPDEVIIDVHTYGEKLVYSFYNPTKRQSISIAAKISEDIWRYIKTTQGTTKKSIFVRFYQSLKTPDELRRVLDDLVTMDRIKLIRLEGVEQYVAK